jgi:hypothetical protein
MSLRYFNTTSRYFNMSLRYFNTTSRYFNMSLRYFNTTLRYFNTTSRYLLMKTSVKFPKNSQVDRIAIFYP